VNCLRQLSDNELAAFLLQLVQVRLGLHIAGDAVLVAQLWVADV
jgi:hypothetical protein